MTIKRLPGQYYDAETNLHYNYFRYYDPSIGRYITSDPIGLDAGPNTYAYVSSNPFKYIDPQGLVEWTGQLRFGSISKRIKIGKINIPITLAEDFKLDLESQCINGRKVEVLIDIVNVDANALNFSPLYIGGVSVSDSDSTPNAGNLSGSFSINFDSFLLGGGDINVGSADGKFFGGGASFGTHDIKGSVSIIDEKEVDCSCE